MTSTSPSKEDQVSRIRYYYDFQSKIYDLTRWSFLFGRKAILEHLPFSANDDFHLLEVGCGTGLNLHSASRLYPQARFTGMDVSRAMLSKARSRLKGKEQIRFIEQPYQKEYYTWSGKLDAILFSYSLTMINPQWPELMAQAKSDLKPGGIIAVVDFHNSSLDWFRSHMGNHHVRMEGHLLPVLKEGFQTELEEVRRAYLGVWEYFMYIGKK